MTPAERTALVAEHRRLLSAALPELGDGELAEWKRLTAEASAIEERLAADGFDADGDLLPPPPPPPEPEPEPKTMAEIIDRAIARGLKEHRSK